MTPLRFGGVRLTGGIRRVPEPPLSPDDTVAEVYGFTPAGIARTMPLTSMDLARLLHDASRVTVHLEHRRKNG